MDNAWTTPDSRPLRYSEMSARRARRLSISPGIDGAAPLIAPGLKLMAPGPVRIWRGGRPTRSCGFR